MKGSVHIRGKRDKSECSSYKGISLLSILGKVYGKILIGRVQEITNGKVSEQQGRFRTGKGCVIRSLIQR